MEAGTTTVARPASTGPSRVMVVDDSTVIRGLIARTLESDPEIKIVASVNNGQMALDAMEKHEIDVVVLDIEMPVMDGMTALPLLLKIDPKLKIVMASTLTLRGAEISMEALSKGAADYVPKPTSSSALATAHDFKRTLVEKVKALGAARRAASARRPAGAVAPAASTPAAQAQTAKIQLRKPGLLRPDVLAIGSSTGGPQALIKVFEYLKQTIPVPILVTQHMPATFTTILATHIQRACGVECGEAIDGEPLVHDRIYVAPGDFHMLVKMENAQRKISLNKNPPVNYCRPAVDPMLDSIAECYGRNSLAVILTGMGHDGRKGCESIVAAGGTAIAQNEDSSVVWGMPGAAANAGVCSAVLPIDDIAPWIQKFIKGHAS